MMGDDDVLVKLLREEAFWFFSNDELAFGSVVDLSMYGRQGPGTIVGLFRLAPGSPHRFAYASREDSWSEE